MDPRRLRMGEWLAGVSGVALLVALFLDWYGPLVGYDKLSAWEAFGVVDVVLALAAVWAIALAAMTALDRSQAVPTALASLLTYVALLALALVLYRVISPPQHLQSATPGARPTGYIPSGDPSREAGLWIGLAASVGVLAGALAALRDDRFPRAVREQNRVEVRTLPTPPPAGGGESGT